MTDRIRGCRGPLVMIVTEGSAGHSRVFRMVPGARIARRVHIALLFPWRPEELRQSTLIGGPDIIGFHGQIAVRLRRESRPWHALQTLFGHSDLETTLNTYTHSVPNPQRLAV